MIRNDNVNISKLFLLIIFVSSHFVSGQQSPWDPSTHSGKTEVVATDQKQEELKTLDDLKTHLKNIYRKYYSGISLNSTDLYLKALGRIEVSRPVIEKKPDSEEARQEFNACSLFTEAAACQILSRYNESLAIALLTQINEVLNTLTGIQENISTIERSKASLLKVDLDAEKSKAQKLEEEARRIAEEANQKFKELESSLIQVKNDARGTIISMSDILFKINKADLSPDLKTSLAKIAGILSVFKTSNIIVEGHTDNQGSAEYNQGLSERRAENVMNFLAEQGIISSRLSFVGYGLTKPVADNGTKEGRQQNRRVDLIIQESKK